MKDAVQKELDDKIHELPDDPPKLELGDGLTNILRSQAQDILDEGFVNKKELEYEILGNIKEQYGFKKIKDAFDEASVPYQLEFFYGGINENLIQACYFLSPNNNYREFIAFLVSDKGQKVMTSNNLSIHVESGNIFYKNLNTNENLYSSLIAQQDETKAIIPKRISYYYRFEKYQ